MKKLIVLAAAAALAVPALGGAAGSTSFADSTGELGTGPDITAVTVSNDDKGVVTFNVAIPNRPALTADMAVLIFLDTDQNSSTGRVEASGAEYGIDYENGTADLGRWNGSQWVWDGPQSSVLTGYAGGLTLKVSTADLGGTTGFNFYAAVIGDDDTIDFAPDLGHGTWNYRVAIAPPAAPASVAKKAPAKKASKPKKKKR
jgi:hypothetical protein